jgi:hypothetical protein
MSVNEDPLLYFVCVNIPLSYDKEHRISYGNNAKLKMRWKFMRLSNGKCSSTNVRTKMHTCTQAHMHTLLQCFLRATRCFLSILRRFVEAIQRRTRASRGTLCRTSATSKFLGSFLCRFVSMAGRVPETRVRVPASTFALSPSPLLKTLQNL